MTLRFSASMSHESFPRIFLTEYGRVLSILLNPRAANVHVSCPEEAEMSLPEQSRLPRLAQLSFTSGATPMGTHPINLPSL